MFYVPTFTPLMLNSVDMSQRFEEQHVPETV
jgi:hypothetical protein